MLPDAVPVLLLLVLLLLLLLFVLLPLLLLLVLLPLLLLLVLLPLLLLLLLPLPFMELPAPTCLPPTFAALLWPPAPSLSAPTPRRSWISTSAEGPVKASGTQFWPLRSHSICCEPPRTMLAREGLAQFGLPVPVELALALAVAAGVAISGRAPVWRAEAATVAPAAPSGEPSGSKSLPPGTSPAKAK